MASLPETFRTALDRFQSDGLPEVGYALLAEFLTLGYFVFAVLFTAETILPGFITPHVSLTKFLFVLVLASFLLVALGRRIEVSFPLPPSRSRPLVWFGVLWTTGILAVSLIRFPRWSIPVIILAFLTAGYLFWTTLIRTEAE